MPSLQDYAQSLLDCTLVALGEADALPCKSFLAPSGKPVWDDCCLCGNGRDGQLWVSVLGAQPKNPFFGAPCGREFRITFRVGLTRCTHTMGENGDFPTAADLNDDATKMFRDREAIFKALTCCFAELFDFDVTQYSIGPWDVLDQQGGCQGQTVDFVLDDTLCSDCS